MNICKNTVYKMDVIPTKTRNINLKNLNLKT